MSNSGNSVRRRELAASLVIIATAVVLTVRVALVETRPAAAATVSAAGIEPSNRWLDGLKSKHKQFFDAPAPAGGIPLVHVMNYYDTYNKAFNVKDADIDAVLTFYGSTTFHGLNDAMWAKYALGEFFEIVDPKTGQPATANPWRSAPVVLGMTLPAASIESLQKRGATFILCNNALTIFSGLLAKARGLDADAVYGDLVSNILPGVDLIPGMVVAIEQAHTANLSYHRQ